MKRTGEKTVLVRFFACPFSWSERQNMSKEAAEAAVSAERGFANGAAEVLRTDARVLLRNNPVVDTPAAGCYI